MSHAGTPTRQLLRLAGAVVRLPPDASSADVPSPCVSICQMSPESNLCLGCLRTIDEIAAWSRMDAATKRAAWERIDGRAKALATSSAPTS